MEEWDGEGPPEQEGELWQLHVLWTPTPRIYLSCVSSPAAPPPFVCVGTAKNPIQASGSVSFEESRTHNPKVHPERSRWVASFPILDLPSVWKDLPCNLNPPRKVHPGCCLDLLLPFSCLRLAPPHEPPIPPSHLSGSSTSQSAYSGKAGKGLSVHILGFPGIPRWARLRGVSALSPSQEGRDSSSSPVLEDPQGPILFQTSDCLVSS